MNSSPSGRSESPSSARADSRPRAAKPREPGDPVPPASGGGVGSWRDHIAPSAAALGVVVLDHLTKWWALVSLRRIDPLTGAVRKILLLPGCLDLSYAENTGAAFSLFHRHPEVLTLVSLVIGGVIFWWYWRTPREHRGIRIALGLVLGGAIGNLIDRIARGYVVDFIHAYWRNYHWPTFNVADSAICVGIALLILWSYREQKSP